MDRICQIPPGERSDDEAALLRAYTDAMEAYMSYCPRRSLKPSPWCMLRYQLSCVKKLPTDVAASDMGMPVQDLQSLVSGERLPTIAEANLLAGYFQTVPDAS
jgi:hypothetical protein